MDKVVEADLVEEGINSLTIMIETTTRTTRVTINSKIEIGTMRIEIKEVEEIEEDSTMTEVEEDLIIRNQSEKWKRTLIRDSRSNSETILTSKSTNSRKKIPKERS